MGVEPASTDDADVIADQWVALADDQRAYGSHIVPEKNRSTIREAILRRIVADELFVAHEGGDLIGFVTFTTETGQYEQDVRRGIVQNLYVLPEHRNQDVGSALLRDAEKRLAEDGADCIALDVMAGNEDARRFYRRQGYAPHRTELEKPVESDTL